MRAAFALLVAIAFWLSGCGGGGNRAPLTIVNGTLPTGYIGQQYNQTFMASGGKAPYSWSVTAGTLPVGLTLTAPTGSLSGDPAHGAGAIPLSISVTDSSQPAQSASFSGTLTILASVSLSRKRAALAVGQALSLTPTTNDPQGVNWSATGASCMGAACGSYSASNTANGVAVTYTAPSAAGLYTVNAVSAGDGTTTASVSVAVTDLSGVTTVHYSLARDGVNNHEYALDPALVNTATFGKLFSCAVDGAIYAQPLWVPGLTVSGTVHNVVFVATQHESLYAFDADVNASPCVPLWQVSLIDAVHGGQAGESSVPSSGIGALVASGYGDIAPEVGVTGTPVLDLATATLYVVSKSVVAAGPAFYQRLHAIDLLTGNEKFGGPTTIAGVYPGTGDGGSTTTFLPRTQNQRSGLALANGLVYIAWASHEDKAPYYGWVMAYDPATLQQMAVVNISPNVGWGGIWMGGDGPAVDAEGNLYVMTGNAVFDANNATAPNNDYGDSFLSLDAGLVVQQYFTPSDQASDDQYDLDLASGGAALVDLPAVSGHPAKLLAGGGKDGYFYLLDRSAMSGFGDSNAWQRVNWGSAIFATPAYFNSTLFMAGVGGALQAFPIDTATGKMAAAPSSASATVFGFPGSSPSISSQPDNSHAVVWTLDNTKYCTPQSPGCGPAVLHAYQPANLANELWNSSQGTGNTAGFPVKFTVPTVANGRVYIGTRGNNQGGADNTTSTPGELDVYGVMPN
jgi:hypothetical protein